MQDVPAVSSAAASPLTTDDLAAVLAAMIASDRTAEGIRDHTGVVRDDVTVAIAQLCQRGLIRDIGGGRYHAAQALCAGPCSRGGQAVRGQEVVINAQTLRWMCATCWDADVERTGST